MTDAQQREAARQFFYRWNGKGKEDEFVMDIGQSQKLNICS